VQSLELKPQHCQKKIKKRKKEYSSRARVELVGRAPA
jgi:hypothetical protein